MKKRVAVWAVLAATVVYAVATGGLAFSSWDDFGGQRNIVLAEGLESDVWLAPRTTGFTVPFVFHYDTAGGPFGLRLQIWDARKRYRVVEVSEVLIEYADGEVVRTSDRWARSLTPYTQYNNSQSGVVGTEMLMLSDQIKSLVLRHVDVRVTLRGRLKTVSGEQVPFSASEAFRAESRRHITTFWEVLAGV